MANNRVFYASHGVALAKETGDTSLATPIYNLQTSSSGGAGAISGLIAVAGCNSVTMNTNFNLDQVFQLGQLELYDNVVTDPSVEVTINKTLDGHPSIYELAVGSGGIVANANKRTKLVLGVGADTNNTLSVTNAIKCDPIYLSSVSYTLGTDGNFTEECTFVGNDKAISTAAAEQFSAPAKAATGASKVLRRQNLNTTLSTLPTEVANENIQSISISADFGREEMFKLGRLSTFHRYVNFPLEVSCDIEVIATGLDTLAVDVPDTACTGLSLSESSAKFVLCDPSGGNEAYTIDLGSKLKLTSVAFGGGDTGGGNSNLTFNYVTFNDLDVQSSGHTADRTTLYSNPTGIS